MSFIKKYIRIEIGVFLIIATIALLASCAEDRRVKNDQLAEATEIATAEKTMAKPLSEAFKKYWYAGEAEITSYQLEQARYGEIREGKSVMVFVTEDFLPEVQVKADRSNSSNVPVLKLNSTKKFLTGLYPYSIMNSTFYPVSDNRHAIKVSFSSQEWCGHVYAQINNKDRFEVTSHSYFEGEADQHFKVDKVTLENEIWNRIRIAPKDLPTGKIRMIPSLEHARLRHKEVKSYVAEVNLTEQGDQSTYSIYYPKLDRRLEIHFNTQFPHEITAWEETAKSGFGPNAKSMTTKATKINTIKSAYWGKNANADVSLREQLGI